MRFSLKTLLATTTLVALGCVGGLYASAVWASFFTTAVLLLILFGIVAAILRQGRARTFWIGFAVFGAGYFGLVNFGETDVDPSTARALQRMGIMGISRWQAAQVTGASQPQLITTMFLVWADRYIQPLRDQSNQPLPGTVGNQVMLRLTGTPTSFVAANPNFLTIGHAIFTLLMAIAGGIVGQWLAAHGPPMIESEGASPA